MKAIYAIPGFKLYFRRENPNTASDAQVQGKRAIPRFNLIMIAVTGFFWHVWLFLVFGGFAIGPESHDRTQRIPKWARMCSALTLVVMNYFVAIFMLLYGSSIHKQFFLFQTWGVTWTFLGDLFLAHLILPWFDGVSFFLGMVCFAIGYGSYALNFVVLRRKFVSTDIHHPEMIPKPQLAPQSLKYRQRVWICYVIGIFCACAGWLTVFVFTSDSNRDSIVIFVSFFYFCINASCMASAVALVFASRSFFFFLAALGTALFAISDLLIGFNTFDAWHFRYVEDFIWVTYAIGQMLQIYGIPLMNFFDMIWNYNLR